MINSDMAALLALITEKSTMNKDDVGIWAKHRAFNKVTLNDAIANRFIASRTTFGENYTTLTEPVDDPFCLPNNLALTTDGKKALEEYQREMARQERATRDEERAIRQEKRSNWALVISILAFALSVLSFIVK